MPIHLVESNRSAKLLEAMAESIGAPRLFEARCVIVPGRHWFSQVKEAMVRRYGAFFQVEILTFDGFTRQVFQKHAPQKIPATPDTLATAIFLELVFTNLLEKPVFSPLRTYLRQGGPEIQRNVAWQVARNLGELFVRYNLQRPELTQLWRTGHTATDSPLEAWQRELFLRVTETLDEDKELPVFPAEWIRVHLQPREVASQLHVLVSPDWSASERIFYSWLADESDVFCYLASPSREFFEHVRRRDFLQERGENHPLLDAWGTLAAHCVAQAHELSGYDSQPDFVEPSADSALGRLQAGILDNFPSGHESPDESLCIWRFFSRRQECAAIRQDIERRLSENPALSTADFAIVVPPADENSPSAEEEIEYVFAQEPVLPIHRAHRRLDSENRMLHAVQALFRLPLLDGSASDVLDFVLHPLVGNFTPEEASWVRNFVNASAVVRFWRARDAAQAAPGIQNHSWEEALTRLALGAPAAPGNIMLFPIPNNENLGVIPLNLTAVQWPVLGRFLTLVHGLRAFCEACRTERFMAQWATFLEEHISLFLHPATQKDEKMRDRVLEVLRHQGELALWNRLGARLTFADMHAVISPFLLRLQVAHSPASGRGVFVGPLQDALWLPFSHAYLVGLEDGVIARQREPASLDVCALENIPGRETGARELELAGCLAVLCGTRESVTFSWCARDPITGDEVAPNVVIRDLLMALNVSERDLSTPPSCHLNMLREWEYAARIAQLGKKPPRSREELDNWPAQARAFWKVPEPLLPVSPTEWELSVSWKKLASFWNFPLQTAARNWIAPDADSEEEPQKWEPERLNVSEINSWFWDAFAENGSPNALGVNIALLQRLETAEASGRAPTGVFSGISRQMLLAKAQKFQNLIKALNILENNWERPVLGMDPDRFPTTLPALRLKGAGRRLVGILPLTSFGAGSLLMDFYASKPEVRHVIDAFVAVLSVCALQNMTEHGKIRVYALFSTKKASTVWEFPAFSTEEALEALAQLAGMSRQPEMLVPLTAEMALEFVKNKSGPASFERWYETEISSALVDEQNQKPKLKRDPVRNPENLVDAKAAFNAALELYLDESRLLASMFLKFIVPVLKNPNPNEEEPMEGSDA